MPPKKTSEQISIYPINRRGSESGVFKQAERAKKNDNHAQEIGQDQSPIDPEVDEKVKTVVKGIEKELRQTIHNAKNKLSAATCNLPYILGQIKKKAPLDLELIDAIEETLEAIKRAAKIMETPLDSIAEVLDHPDSPKRLQLVNLSSVIEKATGPFESQCIFSLQGDYLNGTAICDPERLCQVLGNLIENGIKYNSNPKKKINIVVASMPKTTEITIWDNGVGIPKLEHEKVFEEGYRVEGTAHKKGTGIGLNFCKTAIQKMGGIISIDPDNPVKGTMFLITLHNRTPISTES